MKKRRRRKLPLRKKIRGRWYRRSRAGKYSRALFGKKVVWVHRRRKRRKNPHHKYFKLRGKRRYQIPVVCVPCGGITTHHRVKSRRKLACVRCGTVKYFRRRKSVKFNPRKRIKAVSKRKKRRMTADAREQAAWDRASAEAFKEWCKKNKW